MKNLTLASLALLFAAGPAFAGHHEDCASMEGEAKEQCEKAKAAADQAMADAKKALEELGDCSAKEGDAKTECETKKAELEKAAGEAPAEAEKGGKAARGNTNRMEEEAADE